MQQVSFLKSRFGEIDKPTWYALLSIGVILVIGSVGTLITQGTLSFLSPYYLLQQLQIAAFLGVAATGMMIVILLGHIDLSLPWVLTSSAMLAAGLGGWAALPYGLAVGAAAGLLNGLGVAYLRVPSMIFTLGTNTVLQGLMVLYTGGFAPRSEAPEWMEVLAVGKTLSIPNSLFVWILVGGVGAFVLKKTALGRYIYAVGNQEQAVYLSGIRTHWVLIGAFVMCGVCSAITGMLLAGFSHKAYQAMGNDYLMPAIAAVVIGGTNIMGGRGTYLGTVLGTILIVLLQSMLSVLQMPEAGRQIIYGAVIIAMLLVYGRQRQEGR
ncbi:ABC transporter permease [Sorangium sp. So ce542]|uniref:ABC transporter permease n=1 Tax=Sorangium sp. So ce542 TaxID=3133316 RepID=UPI003F6479A3